MPDLRDMLEQRELEKEAGRYAQRLVDAELMTGVLKAKDAQDRFDWLVKRWFRERAGRDF
jgi:hypothetical protein